MTVAGQGQVSVDTLLGKRPRRPSKWSALLAWRDWRLPVKLAAISFVPIVLAVVLGSIAIVGQLQESERAQRTEQLVTLSTRMHTLIRHLQQERAVTAELLSEGASAQARELSTVKGSVDTAIEGFVSGVRALEPRQGSGFVERTQQAVRAVSATLTEIRAAVAAGQLDAAAAVSKYSEVIAALLDLDTALVAAAAAPELVTTFSAVHKLVVAREMLAVERAVISYGIERSALLPSTLDQLRTIETRFTQLLGDFRVIATETQVTMFEDLVPPRARQTRERIVSAVLNGGGSLATVSEQRWASASSAVLGGMEQVASNLREQLTAAADELAGSATAGLIVLLIVLVLAAALGAFVGIVISAQLLGSLRRLRSSAMDVAHDQLPAVVHSVQQGDRAGTEVAAMPVRSADEVGALARAFDEVHGQAVRLAADQATMRTTYGNVFVNLSRRSQSLVQRQLQLIERLERDEEDADQLATLFQLDHLATRMRRNNENLLVLSGGESGRRAGGPVSVTDVLRAAVSEIEQYQRVTVKPAPEARVVGHAASDLMRLIAELLDNATAFSAPETHVTLGTRLAEDGSLSIDVVDRGIGMNATEVAEANTRMAEATSVELATSRRMGLFVVGRLAGKHGLRATLHEGGEVAGVRANVLIPAGLLAGATGTPSIRASSVPSRAGEASGFGAAQTSGTALPRRTRGANGSPYARPAGGHDVGPWPTDEPPANDTEVSGTALFTPIGTDEPPQPRWPTAETDGAEINGAGANGGGTDGARLAPTVGSDNAGVAGRTRVSGPTPSDGSENDTWDGTNDSDNEVPEPAGGRVDASADSAAVTGGGLDDTGEDGAVHGAAGSHDRDGPDGDGLPRGSDLFAANIPLTRWWSAAERAYDESEQASRQSRNTTGETTPIFNEMASAWFRAASPTQEQSADSDIERSGRWDFAADESWRAVQSVARTEPKSYTAAGLPRRRRGEQLLPGSADSPTGSDELRSLSTGSVTVGSSPERQLSVRAPEEVRGRLSSFQRGLYQGKQQRQDAGGTVVDDSGTNETGSARSDVDPVEPAQSWSFAADASLREVSSVAGSRPTNYTAAGLPRRRRGEQLLPGSAGDGATAPESRTQRDPDSVRGRLSSFQQGVQRGRHQTTESTDGNSEQMEGE